MKTLKTLKTLALACGMVTLPMVAFTSCGGAKEMKAKPLAADAKVETVVLAVTGMTWGSCPGNVQSALYNVEGVSEVKVNTSNSTATVILDRNKVSNDQLISALSKANDGKYSATVK